MSSFVGLVGERISFEETQGKFETSLIDWFIAMIKQSLII